MRIRALILGSLLLGSTYAEPVRDIIDQALSGLDVAASDVPYSRTIERIFIGRDKNNQPRTAVAYRKIESFKPITGVVIIDKTDSGYVLREAVFPDIDKIRNAKERKQVLTVLKQFKNIPFDPHAEKSAVDALSGATRYGIKTSGYLNYMARHLALQMENPPEWSKPN